MNKDRRAALDSIRATLEGLRDEIDSLRSEEEEYYENMPESLQSGEKGDSAFIAMEAMQAAYDLIDEATGRLEEAVQ